MPVDLNGERPLAWDSAALDADTKEMLANLQPNILRAHVREHLSVLFVRFNDVPDGRRFLKRLARPDTATSATPSRTCASSATAPSATA